MEKNFNCPVCGAKCANLTVLKNCIAEHEKAEKDSEAKKREQRIKCLEAENNNLLERVRKNCEELKNLGVSATVTYNTMTETKKQQKDVWSLFGEVIKSNKVDNDKDNVEDLGGLEAFLKAMLGGC